MRKYAKILRADLQTVILDFLRRSVYSRGVKTSVYRCVSLMACRSFFCFCGRPFFFALQLDFFIVTCYSKTPYRNTPAAARRTPYPVQAGFLLPQALDYRHYYGPALDGQGPVVVQEGKLFLRQLSTTFFSE